MNKRMFLKENIMCNKQTTSITDFSVRALPRTKIGLPNLDFHQFSCDEGLIHSKRHLKRSLYIEFEENCLSRFLLKESLPELKFCVSNSDFRQFSCSKWLLYFKTHLKRCLCIPVSFSVRLTLLTVFRLSTKFGRIVYSLVWYYAQNLGFLSLLVLEI